ncbi:hypothetical protein J7643_08025 [bacterium]|nr:hypothetical protein [bacterium]
MSEAEPIAPLDALQDEELDQVAGGTTLAVALDPAQFKPPVSAPTGFVTALPQAPTVYTPVPVVIPGTFVQVSPPSGLPSQLGPRPLPGTLPFVCE